MSITLKDGTEVEDPRLDRLVQFDEKSRNYPIMAVLDARKPRSYTWRCSTVLNQGQEGACVGFGWAHEAAARPMEVPGLTDYQAQEIYRAAQRIDEWPGEAYSGTSLLAGAKIMQERGYIGEYRWAFGLDDLIMALGYAGPAVLGIPWYASMYEAPGGVVRVEGRKVGGHCILARGVSLKRETVLLHNSWGRTWGNDGSAEISFADLSRLLQEQGEVCVPSERFRP